MVRPSVYRAARGPGPLTYPAALLVLAGLCAPRLAAQSAPPPAPVRPVTDTLRGVAVTDPYRRLEDEGPEPEAWLRDREGATGSARLLVDPNVLGEGTRRFTIGDYALSPGGRYLAFSGTSLAAPQVVNLAEKLLALKPELTVAGPSADIRNTREIELVVKRGRVIETSPQR
jgi:hypothetical protein